MPSSFYEDFMRTLLKDKGGKYDEESDTYYGNSMAYVTLKSMRAFFSQSGTISMRFLLQNTFIPTKTVNKTCVPSISGRMLMNHGS